MSEIFFFLLQKLKQLQRADGEVNCAIVTIFFSSSGANSPIKLSRFAITRRCGVGGGIVDSVLTEQW